MRILIAGGGTGGHLYPGIAVAEEVRARGGDVLFVGTTRGIEGRVVPAAGYALELLEVSGLNRVGAWAFARGLGRLPRAFVRSLAIVRRFRPDVVLGVGGYASGPLVLAAALLRRPTAVQEQNSVPGFTNRHLGRVVRAVFTAFEGAGAYFPAGNVVLTGNPVRRSFLEAATRSGGAQAGGERGSAPDLPGRVLVVGGSQGARAVNDLVLAAAEDLFRSGRMPTIVHQTGVADHARVQQAYEQRGLATGVRVVPFIEDMTSAYTAADLVIGRAGALTLAELAVIARPAILIPLPTAADDHQRKNAEAFAAAGAAVVVRQDEANGTTLAALVAALLGDVSRRASMAAAMGRLARPRAAADIVNRLSELALS